MKKILLSALIVLFVVGAVAQQKTLTPVNVTFIINTATVPDTVNSAYSVTITGDNAAITSWGDGVAATNIGGDYWSKTLQLNPGDSLRFKFRVKGAWESNSDDVDNLTSDNRSLIVGAHDTTLPVQFVNFTPGTQLQYRKPWAAIADSYYVVYFRTNMLGTTKGYDPLTDQVGVRGDKSGGSWNVSPDFDWGTTHYLTKESANGNFAFNGSYFWSGAIKILKKNANSGNVGANAGETAEYKFIIGADWGKDEGSNRSFTIPVGGRSDTTLSWTWYNNEKPITRANPDTVNVTFTANMSAAITKQSFSIGDTVNVVSGYFATADSERTIRLARQGLTNVYSATVKILSKVGAPLDYQYYLHKNTVDTREYYYNFQYQGTSVPEQERRQVNVTGNTLTVTDNVASSTDGRRQPYFENQRKLSKAMTVKWEVDLRPAYAQVKGGSTLKDIANDVGGADVTAVDSIAVWGVGINGPGSKAVNDWSAWDRVMVADTSKQKMWDDGTHGDAVAHDTIYTVTISYTTNDRVGQVFKFGIRGGDNESAFGLNHLGNIDDTNPTYTLSDQWGSINPNFYNRWDYDLHKPKTPTSVTPIDNIPQAFALSQNYPNPFNPETKITFSLPVRSNVTLRVYNVLGQEVASLVNGLVEAGSHVATFEGTKLSTGMYFYELKAGEFSSIKKMLLVK